MKQLAKKILQAILGFDRYLFTFAVFKIKTFHWDKKESDFFHFLNLMEKTDHVLDVGSNIGVTSVLLSQHLKQGKVYSFEPLPPNYKTLDKVVSYYQCPNVEVFKFAVGDENKEVEMVLPEVNNVKMQGLSHVVHKDLTEFNDGGRFTTELKRLDGLEVLQSVKIKGIKLDVENFEYFALRGAEAILKRDRPIVYTELWENDNRGKCFAYMQSLGYSIQVQVGGELVNYLPEKHDTQNFFLMPGKTDG